MKKKIGTRNDEIGKKPNREKSLTKSRSFAQSEGIRIPIKKLILEYFRLNEASEKSCRELQEEISIRETSINSPIKGLVLADLLSYKIGKHRFSNRKVKKYFLLTEKNRIQLKLFQDEG